MYPSPAHSDCKSTTPNDLTSHDHDAHLLTHSQQKRHSPYTHWTYNSLQGSSRASSPLPMHNIASDGLRIDLGCSSEDAWASKPSPSASHIALSNGISQLPSRKSTPFQFSPMPQMYPTPVSFEQSQELYHSDSTFLNSSASVSRENSMSPSASRDYFSAEDRFYDYEPCHLAITHEEEVSSRLASEEPFARLNGDRVGYLDIERAMTPHAKTEDTVSKEYPNILDTDSISDDLDYDQFIKVESPEPDNPKRSTKIARYLCPICGKGFGRTFNYNTHLETHDPHRERPYQCVYSHCRKKFYRPTDLKRHDQSVGTSFMIRVDKFC